MQTISDVGAGDAGDANNFWAKLVRFGQIWLDLGEIWAKVIRFGQNQNLASTKTFDFV